MKSLLAVAFASVYGLSIRLLFGFLDNIMGIMSVTFLVLVPMLIGFVTIIVIPKQKGINGVGAFFLPWLTSLVILVITMLLNIEGSICWIMIYPFFAILAGLGGLIAYYIKKGRAKNMSNDNDFGKPTTLNMSLLFLLPAFAGYVEGEKTLTPRHFNMSEEVIIAASPKEVWKELTHINELESKEKTGSFSGMLGFPRHLRTVLDTPAIGGKRIAIYEKGLYFKETISQYEPEHLMALDIKTDPKNIPPTVMDEHILIGGKHIDILEDVYKLEALPDGKSRLTLSTHFYINTPFNWYSGIWAHYLMKDILQEELELIKTRTTSKLN